MFELGETWADDFGEDGNIDPDEIIGYLQVLFPKVFEVSTVKLHKSRLGNFDCVCAQYSSVS